MTPEEFRTALNERGFRFCEHLSRFIGPYNVQVDGLWAYDQRRGKDAARVEELARIDEVLRDKRGLPRPQSSGGPGAGIYSFT
ncbi:MAG: hypothetical protein AB7L09_02640 [Nitrospira sp.]